MTENNRMHAPRTFYCHELDIWNGVMHGSDRKTGIGDRTLKKRDCCRSVTKENGLYGLPV